MTNKVSKTITSETTGLRVIDPSHIQAAHDPKVGQRRGVVDLLFLELGAENPLRGEGARASENSQFVGRVLWCANTLWGVVGAQLSEWWRRRKAVCMSASAVEGRERDDGINEEGPWANSGC